MPFFKDFLFDVRFSLIKLLAGKRGIILNVNFFSTVAIDLIDRVVLENVNIDINVKRDKINREAALNLLT